VETGLFVFCAALNEYDVRHSLTYDCQLRVPTTRPLRLQQVRNARHVKPCTTMPRGRTTVGAKEIAQAIVNCRLGRRCAIACQTSRKSRGRDSNPRHAENDPTCDHAAWQLLNHCPGSLADQTVRRAELVINVGNDARWRS